MNYRIVLGAEDGYQFRGGNLQMLRSVAPQAMLAGPSDTGKTFTCCVKVHLLCCAFPGSQHSIVRKTFSSLAGSVCQTYARVCAGAGVQVLGLDSPRLYTYPNGSKVWLGGMDKPEKTLSSERDTIYVPQAEQLTQNEWELLARAVSGRSAVVPNPQLFGDCNPAGSRHWLRDQARTGKMEMFTTGHKDNPSLFHKDGRPVEVGEVVCGVEMKRSGLERIKTLSDFTGVRRKRLFEGVWATAEGAVFDNFDAAIHVVVRGRSEFKRFLLCQDEGYTNPAVILLVGEDSDKRWHVLKEFYEAGKLEETVVREAKRWFTEYKCELDAVDAAAAGLIASLKAVGVNAVGGKGSVADGCSALRDRLKVQGDGKPRLTFDPSCVNCINEMESYVFKEGSDVPKKENDHAPDALRYLEDAVSRSSGSVMQSDRPAAYANRLVGVRGESMW